MFPYPFNEAELWAVRRLKQQDNILWHNQIVACIKPSVIHLQQLESKGLSLGELIEEAWVAVGIDMGEL